MDSLLKKYLKGDTTLWVVYTALCIISVVEMYSASSTLAFKAGNHTAPVLRHFMFLLGGTFIAIVVHLVPLRFIRLMSYFGVLLSIALLIAVQFMGQTENDATRWLVIGGVQFQPSELAKISLIVLVADLISRIKNPEKDEKRIFWIIIGATTFTTMLILLENFSTAVLLYGVVMVMMFIGHVSFKRLGLLTGIFVGIALLGYLSVSVLMKNDVKLPKAFNRATTWVNRIDRFMVEKEDPAARYEINDDNRQVQHGRIAIARGGVFGVFPGNSVERDFLPQAYSDFIYAIILEEMGFVGGLFVILLYMALLFRAGRIATESPTVFPAILMIGLSLMIVLQAFVSMSVATSLGPVTGQPLPLISRGGTSILITCIYFGIILGITNQIKKEKNVDKELDEKEEEKHEYVKIEDLTN